MENIFDDQTPDSESVFYQYVSVLKKRRAVIFSFSGVLIITAIISTMFATRYYSAKSVIEIMPIAPSIMGGEGGDAVTEMGAGSDSRLRVYYGTQFAILSSYKVLSKTIEKLKFEHGFEDFDDKEDPVVFLKNFMRLSPQPETTLVHIKIEYPDHRKAAIIANVIANVYMENNLDNNLSAVRAALSGIEKEHQRYREAKLESDERVHDFKFENHLIGIEKQATYIQSKMASLQQVLTTIQVTRIQVEADYQKRLEIFNSEEWISLAKGFSKTDRVLQQYFNARVVLMDDQNKLSVRYKSMHPEMLVLKKQLKSNSKSIYDEVLQELSAQRTELEVLIEKEKALQEELSFGAISSKRSRSKDDRDGVHCF